MPNAGSIGADFADLVVATGSLVSVRIIHHNPEKASSLIFFIFIFALPSAL